MTAPEEQRVDELPALERWQRLDLVEMRLELPPRLGVGDPRGEQAEPLPLEVAVPALVRHERDVVPARSERPREREQRPDVAVQRRRREQSAHTPIITHGNRHARATV
ncbi:MAG TPA: hypothetical protein VEW11_03800 [Gaiellaceae bacterium]|nr:hypothetical protein [Gaiellaceae bacterium]